MVAASNPRLASGEVERTTSDGHLTLHTRSGGAETVLEVQGAPTFALHDSSGATIAHLHVLPGGQLEETSRQEGPRFPLWMLATRFDGRRWTGVDLRRRAARLGPVSALTGAVRRMEQGDLVRVEAARGRVADLGRAFNAGDRLGDERLRRQMVSDVAHELRSPVTNLRCTLEAMQDGLTAMDRDGVDLLLEETLFLQRLIADLQDLALAEAGRLTLQSAPVDAGETIRRAAASLGTSAGAAITLTSSPIFRR